MGLVSKVGLKMGQKLLNCFKSSRSIGEPINIGELLKDASRVKVGLFDEKGISAITSKSSKKPYEPLANMLLKPLVERFRIAKEFLKHGHNPSEMVSKSEVEKLLAEKLKNATKIKLPVYKKKIVDKELENVTFIKSQIEEDINAGKEMLKILV